MNEKYSVPSSIIYAENNRVIKKGLVGNLSNSDFNNWCINWWFNHCQDEFGLRQNDGILRDPYTGYAINNDDKDSKLVVEHVIPVDRDGGTILFNIVPARSDVNSRKSNRDPLEYLLSIKII